MRLNAGAIIYRFDAGRLHILLVHQSDKRKNLWSIPKGGVEPEEDFEQGARRELFEETGVKIEHLDFLAWVDYPNNVKRLYCFMAPAPSAIELRCKAPEIDNAGFFKVGIAKRLVEKRQRAPINALQKQLIYAMRKSSA